MTVHNETSRFGFALWDADDALDALHRAGLDIDHVEQARWPANAPQPRTQRQAFTFRSPGIVDPHLLLVFETAEALEAWRLWLARYWRARPYLSIKDNILLLVSREVTAAQAARFHEALARLGTLPARTRSRRKATATETDADATEAAPEPAEAAPAPRERRPAGRRTSQAGT